MNKDFKELFNKLGITINDESLYRSALTHVSYVNEHPEEKGDYDRLEFIGDSVLDIILADLLYRHFPTYRSGSLSKFRSYFVKGTSLAEFADYFHILDYARLSNGEMNNNLDRNKLKEDMFEALLGAIYLDHDYEYIYNLLSKLYVPLFSGVTEDSITDNKTRLQEVLQSQGRSKIEYRILEEKGSAQDKYYKIAVVYDDVILGIGEGSNKKKAEQNAAGDALTRKVN